MFVPYGAACQAPRLFMTAEFCKLGVGDSHVMLVHHSIHVQKMNSSEKNSFGKHSTQPAEFNDRAHQISLIFAYFL